MNPLTILDKWGKEINLGNVTTLYVDNENKLWIGSQNKGLFCYDFTQKSIVPFSDKYKQGYVREFNVLSIGQDKWGRIWVGTSENVYLYDADNRSFSPFKCNPAHASSLPHPVIWRFEYDRNNDMWFCTNGKGISKLIDKDFRFVTFAHDKTNPNSLNDNFVQCFMEDFQGNLWIGTQRGGVSYCLNNNSTVFKSIRSEPFQRISLSDNSVTAINQDAQGNIWIGTDGGGINVYNPRENTIQYLYRGRPVQDWNYKESILTIYIDKRGEIWAGGYLSGIIRISADRKRVKIYMADSEDPAAISHNDIRWIMEDSKGNLWVATNGGGLNIYDPSIDGFKHLTTSDSIFPLVSNYTLTLLEDSKGNMWVGTYSGISRLDFKRKKIFSYSRNDKLKGEWIYAFLENSEGKIWVATNLGLYQYNSKTDDFTDVTGLIGVPNQVIGGIVEDKEQTFWISTYNGLIRYNPFTRKSIIYYQSDGLPGNNFNHGAYYKNQQGMLFWGTTSGLVFFDPSRIVINEKAPDVYITAFTDANGNLIPIQREPGNSVEIKYSMASAFNIHFAALNYINPEKNQYAIYMEGIDRDWRKIGNQQVATYTNLAPGTYVFRVKASNNDNVWNEQGTSLTIHILPPLWRTVWAYILYFILIVSLIVYIWYQTLLRVRYKKDLEIEHLKAEKAEEIAQMKSEFFLSISHELNTPLSLIITPIEKMEKEHKFDARLMQLVKRNAHLLLRMLNELIDFQKADEGREQLNLAFGEMVQFVKHTVENFYPLAENKKITLSFTPLVNQLWMEFDHNKIEKIIYNLISNAIKYTPQGGKVTVTIGVNQDHSQMFLSVEDTGIGINQDELKKIFDKYYRIRKARDPINQATGFGIGLYLSQKLAELHQGKLEVKSVVGKGSCFTLSLPWERKGIEISAENVEQQIILDENEKLLDDTHDEEEFVLHTKKPLILIIEDNREVCEMLEILLRSKYQLLFAHEGNEGYKLVTKYMPQLVITDIMLPGIDGLEICRRIKADFYTSHIPVVILT
ncbi:MAG: two-component regulator propeller domain-containing protein, partial [Bacteroidales bacterium]